MALPTAADGRRASGTALGIAILLHLLLVLVPMSRQLPPAVEFPGHLQVLMTTPERPTKPPLQSTLGPKFPVTRTTQPTTLKDPRPLTPVNPEPPASADLPALNVQDSNRQSHLASTLLSRQFISEKSVTEQIFGVRPGPDNQQDRQAFHFPDQVDMRSLLDKPLPDLPFEYTPGLVRFAYEPGVRGDLQRFWDTITPEFGWTTRHGTEVRCVWVLLIAACGWK